MGVLAKVLVGGAVVAVVGLVLASSSNANASSGAVPPPKPGPGAIVESVPAGIVQGVPALKRTLWAVSGDASGQQPGTMILTQVAGSPNDWVLAFRDTKGGVGILQYAQTPMAGLIAQAVAAGL